MSSLVRYTNEDDQLAKRFAESGQWDSVKTTAIAAVRIMFGRDMGLTPTESMAIHIIEGKPELPAGLMASAIKRSGRYWYEVIEYTETRVAVQFFAIESGELRPLSTPIIWRIDVEAKHLAGRAVWKQYPRQMLRCRAISEGYRTHCPDALGGSPVYVEGEIDTSRRDVTPAAVEAEEPPSPPAAHEQLTKVFALLAQCEQHQPNVRADMERFFGRPIEDFSEEDAAAAIVHLQAKIGRGVANDE